MDYLHVTTLPAMVLQAGIQQTWISESLEGTERQHVAEGGSVIVIVGQAPTYHVPAELFREWPEVVVISRKLVCGEELSGHEEEWIDELAKACGWSVSDVVEELENIDVNPINRVERYKELFEEYYEEAKRFKEMSDTRQAGEKIWGAVVALIKLYAATKGVFIVHWSMRRLDNFITYNIEAKYKDLFRDLLDKAHRLHEHFYEGDLDERSFEERWVRVIEYLEKARRIVYWKIR